jgi:hypothetical protein
MSDSKDAAPMDWAGRWSEEGKRKRMPTMQGGCTAAELATADGLDTRQTGHSTAQLDRDRSPLPC